MTYNYRFHSQTYYELLGVKIDASQKEIWNAFRQKTHSSGTIERWAIREAGSVLVDVKKRRLYDLGIDGCEEDISQLEEEELDVVKQGLKGRYDLLDRSPVDSINALYAGAGTCSFASLFLFYQRNYLEFGMAFLLGSLCSSLAYFLKTR